MANDNVVYPRQFQQEVSSSTLPVAPDTLDHDAPATFVESPIDQQSHTPQIQAMANDITREELSARLAEQEAKSEARFERLSGDIRTSQAETLAAIERMNAIHQKQSSDLSTKISVLDAKSIGKTSFIFGLLALFAAILAVMALAPAWFANGIAVTPTIQEAARTTARAAVEEVRKEQLPSPSRPTPPTPTEPGK